jgi:hypothetical protein
VTCEGSTSQARTGFWWRLQPRSQTRADTDRCQGCCTRPHSLTQIRSTPRRSEEEHTAQIDLSGSAATITATEWAADHIGGSSRARRRTADHALRSVRAGRRRIKPQQVTARMGAWPSLRATWAATPVRDVSEHGSCRRMSPRPAHSNGGWLEAPRRATGSRSGAGDQTGPPRPARYRRRPARRPPGTTARRQSDRQ